MKPFFGRPRRPSAIRFYFELFSRRNERSEQQFWMRILGLNFGFYVNGVPHVSVCSGICFGMFCILLCNWWKFLQGIFMRRILNGEIVIYISIDEIIIGLLLNRNGTCI